MLEILRLAVAAHQPQPEAEEPRVALGAEVGVGGGECRRVEGGLLPGDLGAVVREKLALEGIGHRHARVLQEGDQIESGVLVEGVLEIQDADAGDPLALGQPHQVRRVVVAQEPAAGQRQQPVEHGRPERLELGAHGRRCRARP